MLEYSSILNVGVKKGIINGFWSVNSVSEQSGGAPTAPPAPMPMLNGISPISMQLLNQVVVYK